VKKAAKSLLKTFADRKRELFTYNWYKERQKQEEVEYAIGKVLNNELPHSYDTDIFRKKKYEVFEHIYHLAEIGDERFIYDVSNNSDYKVDSSDMYFVAQPKPEYN